MYKNKIVVALKHNNKPLVEDKDTVFLPFNTTYSVYIKNMADDIALISLYINGRDVNPGKKIRIYPKCSVNIEKFQDTNHTFVFKERTIELQEVRENLDEDGLVQLDVGFEDTAKLIPFPFTNPFGAVDNCGGGKFKRSSLFDGIDTTLYRNSFEPKVISNTTENSLNAVYSQSNRTFASNKAETLNSGITVPGKKKETSDHAMFCGSSYASVEFSMIIHLRPTENKAIDRDTKKVCPTCEKKFKYTYFYCPYDGTFLDEEES